MLVQRITTWHELLAIEPHWNALASEVPFRTWDWLATWWKHYGLEPTKSAAQRPRACDRQLCVLAVYREPLPTDESVASQLIGIAPWYIERTKLKGRVLRWLGDGEVCSDHVSILCQPHDAQQVAAQLAETLTDQFDDWDLLELNHVDADDAAVSQLLIALDSYQCRLTKEPADACWALDLPLTWEEYLAGISKSHRKQLRQLERRVLESDRVVWHRVATAAELNAAWPILVDLHQRRRQSLGEPGCFASQSFHDFHREVAERLLGLGQLRISWLALDGTPAAAEYHFADRTATYAYQGGVDPDRLAEEPGRLSTILCLKRAIEEGHERLDFLRGAEPYKAHWRATPRATWNYRVSSNRAISRLRGQAITLAGALSNWARQGLSAVHSTPES